MGPLARSFMIGIGGIAGAVLRYLISGYLLRFRYHYIDYLMLAVTFFAVGRFTDWGMAPLTLQGQEPSAKFLFAAGFLGMYMVCTARGIDEMKTDPVRAIPVLLLNIIIGFLALWLGVLLRSGRG